MTKQTVYRTISQERLDFDSNFRASLPLKLATVEEVVIRYL